MKHAKKFLSLALVGTMLTACSSLTAFAQDDTRINQPQTQMGQQISTTTITAVPTPSRFLPPLI